MFLYRAPNCHLSVYNSLFRNNIFRRQVQNGTKSYLTFNRIAQNTSILTMVVNPQILTGNKKLQKMLMLILYIKI